MLNIDSVYKTVLLILNKEQRGYMTPDEFNKIGSQVQREIFETYFEDLNQQVRIQQTEYDYSNRVYNTDEKIAELKTYEAATYDSNTSKFSLPENLYRLNAVVYNGSLELQRLTRNEYYNVAKSKLTKPTESCPIYLYEDNKLLVFPQSIESEIDVSYVKKPKDIRWGYETGSLGQYIFTDYEYVADGFVIEDYSELISANTSADGLPDAEDLQVPAANVTCTNPNAVLPSITISNDPNGTVTVVKFTTSGGGFAVNDVITIDVNFPGNQPIVATGTVELTVTSEGFMENNTEGYVDFSLHDSERQELVIKILLYAGIVVRDPQIIQTSMSQIQQEAVNEKQ